MTNHKPITITVNDPAALLQAVDGHIAKMPAGPERAGMRRLSLQLEEAIADTNTSTSTNMNAGDQPKLKRAARIEPEHIVADSDGRVAKEAIRNAAKDVKNIKAEFASAAQQFAVAKRLDLNRVPFAGFRNLKGEKARSIRNAYCRMAASALLDANIHESREGLTTAELVNVCMASLTKHYAESGNNNGAVPKHINSHFGNALAKHPYFVQEGRRWTLTPKLYEDAGITVPDPMGRGILDAVRNVHDLATGKVSEHNARVMERVFKEAGIDDLLAYPDNTQRFSRLDVCLKTIMIAGKLARNGALDFEYRGKSYSDVDRMLAFYGGVVHDLFHLRPKSSAMPNINAAANNALGIELYAELARAAGKPLTWVLRSWERFHKDNKIYYTRFDCLEAIFQAK